MQIQSTLSDGTRTCIRPSADNLETIIITPEKELAPNAKFFGYAPFDTEAEVDGSPDIGDEIGTVEDSWTLSTGKTGFKAHGATGGRARIRPFNSKGKLINIGSYTFANGVSGTGSSTEYGSWLSIDTDVYLNNHSYLLIDRLGVYAKLNGEDNPYDDILEGANCSVTISLQIGNNSTEEVLQSTQLFVFHGYLTYDEWGYRNYILGSSGSYRMVPLDSETDYTNANAIRFKVQLTFDSSFDETEDWRVMLDDHVYGSVETMRAYVM
jgi:hypothetical protein